MADWRSTNFSNLKYFICLFKGHEWAEEYEYLRKRDCLRCGKHQWDAEWKPSDGKPDEDEGLLISPTSQRFKPKLEDPEPLPVVTQSRPPLAWKAWRMKRTERGPRLMATVTEYLWGGPVQMNSDPPTEGNPFGRLWNIGERSDDFGFYAHKELAHIETYISWVCRVVGQIKLLGSVIEHENGWRAQGAKLVKLRVYPGGWERSGLFTTKAPAPWFPYGEAPDVIEELETFYGVPVEFVEEEPETPQDGTATNALAQFNQAFSMTTRSVQYDPYGRMIGYPEKKEDEERSPLFPKPDIKEPTPEDIQTYGGS